VGETNGPRELIERREKERWMSKVLDLDSEHRCGNDWMMPATFGLVEEALMSPKSLAP
jgi:hypothetical protein